MLRKNSDKRNVVISVVLTLLLSQKNKEKNRYDVVAMLHYRMFADVHLIVFSSNYLSIM